jgi:hypothetical protein
MVAVYREIKLGRRPVGPVSSGMSDLSSFGTTFELTAVRVRHRHCNNPDVALQYLIDDCCSHSHSSSY